MFSLALSGCNNGSSDDSGSSPAQAKDYSYYILSEKPAYYKDASKVNDKVVFGKIISTPKDM